uniref:Uncharacterized protein n=1 Tax=Siphoviridae sp. ct13O11 TaxID=2825303 RepID=A0A8S5UD48_9CAUD|nr:MAG TPA: hypothetical protein [Siphoviridae sp. ct13O11]
MMQLTINNQIAEIKKGTTIKLTRVNPYFADQGDYTLEVQLPLRGGPTNLAIFGPRNHPATTQYPHIGEQYTMQLIAPPLQLEGTATVTSITETEVKVQLKAGVKASPLNNDTTYIDELELGNAWDGFGSVRYSNSEVLSSGTDVRTQIKIFSSCIDQKFLRTTTPVRQAAYGTYGQTDAICLPIYSSTDDIIANPMDMITTTPGLDGDSIDNITLAPCPYLLDITARIFKCLGFTPRNWRQYTENSLTKAIYIANTRQTLQRAKILPHWTVKEYLNELQNLLGCVFTFSGRYVDMYTRQHYYTQNREPITITQVSDTHTINISTDPEAETTANGNVDYDYPNISPMLRLPDEVWQNATILPTATYEEAKNHYDKLTDYYKKQSPNLYTVTPTNRAYAILITDHDTPVLREVDQFAPLMRTTDREQMTKLRITPANMLITNPLIATNNGQFKDDKPEKGRYPIIAVADTILTKRNIYSVNDAINPPDTDTTDTTTEAKDHIDIAWYNGENDTYYKEASDTPTLKFGYHSLCPIAIPYTTELSVGPLRIPTLHTKAYTFPTPEGPFALTTKGPTTPSATYGNIGQLLTTAPTIDTRIELQVQFTDQINPDPTQPYLIGSRSYACARLEITIDQNGIQPLKQAYLYEIQ